MSKWFISGPSYQAWTSTEETIQDLIDEALYFSEDDIEEYTVTAVGDDDVFEWKEDVLVEKL